jgi:hypothetical protein
MSTHDTPPNSQRSPGFLIIAGAILTIVALSIFGLLGPLGVYSGITLSPSAG